MADIEMIMATFLVAQICTWSYMGCVVRIAEALRFSYRAGLDGYLGVGVMVAERTGLFELPECVGGQMGLAQPPKLTHLLNNSWAGKAPAIEESFKMSSSTWEHVILWISICIWHTETSLISPASWEQQPGDVGTSFCRKLRPAAEAAPGLTRPAGQRAHQTQDNIH